MGTDELLHAAILIVDDQPVNVQLLEYLLASTGYSNVASTTDPRKVTGLHEQYRYDLIILDLHMPGMSGFDVMRALQALEPDYLPVLVVTADPDKKLAALDAGARDFVGKPFDPVEVLTRIRNMLEVRLLHKESRSYGVRLEKTVRQRTAELQRFRSAIDATDDAIFVFDAASRQLIDVNEGGCRMLDLARAELQARAPEAYGLPLPDCAGEGCPAELTLATLHGATGREVPVELSWHVHHDEGQAMLIAVARDISERIAAQQQLEHMASYDGLTGLPNRAMFMRTLSSALQAAAQAGTRVIMLFITLDRFKLVNDSMGASAGDELLRQFSGRLVQCVAERDKIGRLGGDEFGLVLTHAPSNDDAIQVANALREALRTPFVLEDQRAVLTASIGIAVYPDDAADAETLVRNADTAMVRAKGAGRDGFRFFTASMNAQVMARLDMELALRGAIANNEFILCYQPKADLSTGGISGAEALIRWNRPGHGLVYPAEFVPILEETGMIVRAGTWAIHEACRQIAAWQAEGVGDVRVAVNVSSRQFVEGDLESDIRSALERHRVDPRLLELELTESALMANAEHTVAVLARLKSLGIRVAIDDFGTGYSSLAYLKRFPIDKLKIDIAFVRDVIINPDDAAIALAIISMAHSLNLHVIAEGVESAGQMNYLRRHRCDEIQGFHFSRPLFAHEMAEMARRHQALQAERASADESRQTVLLVDEDEETLEALRSLLEQDHYRIFSATTAREAFELLALHRVQVVICDRQAGGMSGVEFLGRVKDMYPDTVRVIVSGYAAIETVLEAVNRGAISRFYTKPWDDLELRDNVRQAFHHYWLVNGPREEGETSAPPGGPGLPSSAQTGGTRLN
jgi:diguanylate cyclase (GGDEF)-like protein